MNFTYRSVTQSCGTFFLHPAGTLTWTEILKRCPLCWTSSWSVFGSWWSSSPAPLSLTSASSFSCTHTSTPASTATSSATARESAGTWGPNIHVKIRFQQTEQPECWPVCVCVCRMRERTHSLWPCLWENRSEFINPLYRSDHSQTQGVLRPLTTPYCFKWVPSPKRKDFNTLLYPSVAR